MKMKNTNEFILPAPLPEDDYLDKGKKVYSTEIVGKINHIYLVEEITEPVDYIEIMKALNTALETDSFVFHINCWGGDLYTAIQLRQAIQSSEASVTCSIEGACASAATLIALACEGWALTPLSTFMIHAPTSGNFGKANELKQSQAYSDKWQLSVFENVYQGFLTSKEIEECLEGKDFWFDAEETLDRITKGYIPYLTKKKEQQQKEAEAEAKKAARAKKR